MDWKTLLTPIRYGDEKPREHNSKSNRSIFEQDYDRIVFSLPFRKLQDKTQVIPLPENDFVHNRLTHSIEVSSVGRSLGKAAGLKLIDKYNFIESECYITFHDIGAIVAAASLAHDIGNPPFGHSGEKAISDFFINRDGAYFKEFLSENEYADLCNFEGNANGFKILTNDASSGKGGIRLSYPTLAAFTKYPKPVLPKIHHHGISHKKYGFFSSERQLFNDIAIQLGLVQKKQDNCFYRHPLAFLVEAADDICYSIIDFEDGVRLGFIPFDKAEHLLKEIAGSFFYEKNYNNIKYHYEKVSYLRAVAISSLVAEISEIFIQIEPKMLACEFDSSLINMSKHIEVVKEIKKISYNLMYCNNKVLELEAAGFEVIARLLRFFTNGVRYAISGSSQNNYSIEKLMQLLPDAYKKTDDSIYNQLLAICQFVAGLSDRHAIQLHQKLTGNLSLH